MDPELKKGIASLRGFSGHHHQLAERILKAGNGAVYVEDFLMLAVLKRSLSLTRGFCDMIESSNFTSGATLVRLQLDNVLRAAAPGWVADQGAFAMAVLGGKRIDQIKGRDGQRLTDRNLVERVARTYPWVESVYEETSGFVHLSYKHIFNALQVTDRKERVVTFRIGDRDECVPDSAYLEAARAYLEITNLLLGVVDRFACSKERRPHPKRPPA